MNGNSTGSEHGDIRKKAKEEERTVKDLEDALSRAAAMAVRRGKEIQVLMKERDEAREELRKLKETA